MQPIPKPNRHPVSKLSLIPALISLTTGLVHAEILDTSFQAVDSLRHEAIASWNFDQNQGDTLLDASGHKYNGVIHGAKWVNGVSGKGLSFAGQDWVEIPGDSNLALQSFTFSIWLHQSGNGLRCPLIEFQKPGETVGVHLWANAGGWSADYPGSFFGNIRPADASLSQSGSYRERNLIITDGGTAPGGRWNHVVLTYEHETSASNLYVNGKLQKSVAFIAPLEPRTSGSIFLGMRSPTSLDWDAGMGLVGILDQADIFNRALSKSEVRTLYGRTVEEPKTMHLGIKTHYAKADDTLWVPLYLSSDGKDSLSSLQFTLNLDTNVVSLLDIQVDTTLAPNWRLADWNRLDPTSTSIALAGTQTITGPEEGPFLRLKLHVHSQAKQGASSMLTLTDIAADENKHSLISHTPGKVFVLNTDILYGDVNDDKEVDLTDAQIMLECVVGKFTLPNSKYPNFRIAVADVSGNGTVTSYDAALVLQYGLGILDGFPVENKIEVTPLAKRAAAAMASLTLDAPTLVSGTTYRYRIQGDNLEGLIGGELLLETSTSILSIVSVRSGIAGVRVSYQLDIATKRLEIALAANRKFQIGKVGFIDIEVTQEPGTLQGGLTLKSAHLNEGKLVATGMDSQPLTSLVPENNPTFQGRLKTIASRNQWRFSLTEDWVQAWEIFDSRGHRITSAHYAIPAERVEVGRLRLPQGLLHITLHGKSGRVVTAAFSNIGF